MEKSPIGGISADASFETAAEPVLVAVSSG
jgi:hypothetical protein